MRHDVALVMTARGVRSALLFDPRTYQLIGWVDGWLITMDSSPSLATPGSRHRTRCCRPPS
ncbi:MAG TPA: hypothetical protein VGH27_36150 [Streptosporangiaceae bacterium]|jgi:hypothetical protein